MKAAMPGLHRFLLTQVRCQPDINSVSQDPIHGLSSIDHVLKSQDCQTKMKSVWGSCSGHSTAPWEQLFLSLQSYNIKTPVIYPSPPSIWWQRLTPIKTSHRLKGGKGRDTQEPVVHKNELCKYWGRFKTWDSKGKSKLPNFHFIFGYLWSTSFLIFRSLHSWPFITLFSHPPLRLFMDSLKPQVFSNTNELFCKYSFYKTFISSLCFALAFSSGVHCWSSWRKLFILLCLL